jgi:hypothetical protein
MYADVTHPTTHPMKCYGSCNHSGSIRDCHNWRFDTDSSTRFKMRFPFIRNDSRSRYGLLIWEQAESAVESTPESLSNRLL